MRQKPQELAAAVAANSGELADAALARLQAEHAIDATTAANLRLGLLTALERFCERLADPSLPLDLALFEAHGRAQYVAGRTLEEMLAFYRVGGLAMWERAQALAGVEGVTVEGALEVSRLVLGLVDELSEAAASGFRAEQAELARRRHAALESLWAALVSRPPRPPEELQAAAAAAGWELPERVRVGVAPAGRRRDEHATRREPPARVLSAAGGDEVRALLVAATPDHEQWLRRAAGALGLGEPLVVGPSVPAAEGARSLDAASALLRHLAPREPRGVIRCDEHLAELLLAAAPDITRAICEHRLAPLAALPADSRARLLDTLRGWIDHPGRPQAIADLLGVHVQTVRYRLRRLRELLGDALDDPQARFELAIALRCEPADALGLPQRG